MRASLALLVAFVFGARSAFAKGVLAEPLPDLAPLRGDGKQRCSVETEVDVLVPDGWFFSRESGVCELRTPDREFVARVLVVPAQNIANAFYHAWETAWPNRGQGAYQVQEAQDPEPYDSETTRHYVSGAGGYRERAVVRMRGARAIVFLVRASEHAWGAADRSSMELLRSTRAWGLKEPDLSAAPLRALSGDDWTAMRRLAVRAGRAAGASSISYCVVRRGESDHCETVGTDDAPRERFPLYLIGSLSKVLSTAALDVQNEGTWTPAQREGFCACSGHSRHDMPLLMGLPPDPAALRSYAFDTPAIAPVGELYSYNNALSAITAYEAASAAEPGKPLASAYTSWLRARLLRPLQMRSTSTEWLPETWSSSARPHAPDMSGVVHALPMLKESFARSMMPATGVASTAPDLARYLRFELGLPRSGPSPDAGIPFRTPARVYTLRAPGVTVDSRWSYALGAMVGSLRGIYSVQHSGATLGFGSMLTMFPSKGLGLVVLTDVQRGANVGAVLRDELLARALGGAHVGVAALRALAPIPKIAAGTRSVGSDVLAWAGAYEHPLAGRVFLRVLGDEVMLQTPGQGDLRLGVWLEQGRYRLYALDAPFAGLLVDVTADAVALRGADAVATVFTRVH